MFANITSKLLSPLGCQSRVLPPNSSAASPRAVRRSRRLPVVASLFVPCPDVILDVVSEGESPANPREASTTHWYIPLSVRDTDSMISSCLGWLEGRVSWEIWDVADISLNSTG